MPFSQYKDCQRMTKNEFSRWLATFFDTAYEEGYQQACSDVPEGSIIVTPDQTYLEFEYEEFLGMLMSVKGIGQTKAEAIMDRLYEFYDAKRELMYEMKTWKGEENQNGKDNCTC